MHPLPAGTTHHDQQDLVNRLLAAALHARATLENVRRTAALIPADQTQAATDLTDAATAFTHIHDALLRAANEVTAQVDAGPPTAQLHGRPNNPA